MGRHATAVRIGTTKPFGALAAALLSIVAACQAGPAPPLLSPLDQVGRYGYRERDLGPDRIEVSYLGPRHRVVGYVPTPRDAESRTARDEAFDVATWRVAQVALARGLKGFRIVDRQVQVESRPEAFYGGPDWGPQPYWRNSGIIYGPPGFYSGSPPFSDIQARITVTAELVAEPAPGDEDARAVVERRRAAYGPEDAPRR